MGLKNPRSWSVTNVPHKNIKYEYKKCSWV
uniref:Uncharacterized protein n=1 Tax=Myoviridae sp. ctNQV2 TaxID=2827683 RepID=A0A8S5RZV1_9CAUD|nr:MAG TPA: hypothetical protein [Myoviridae sp. ctNQV2]